MKKLLLPILTLLLITACNKDSDISPEVSAEHRESASILSSSAELSSLPVFAQDVVLNKLENSQADLHARDLEDDNSNESLTSQEPVFVADFSIPTDEIAGHCTITRTDQGAHFTWYSFGLAPEQSYQIYAVVLNLQDCIPVSLDVITLGEKTANPTGRLLLNTFLANGDTSNSWFGPFGSGMTEAKKADLLVFARISGTGNDVRISTDYVCD